MKRLLLASLMHSFGHASPRPLRRACCITLLLLLATLGISWVVTLMIAGIPFQPPDNPYKLYLWLLAGAAGCSGLAYLTTSGIYARQRESFCRLLSVLPIPYRLVWLCTMLPRLYLGMLSTLLCLPPCLIVANRLGLSTIVTVLITGAGYCLATGSLYAVSHVYPHRYAAAKPPTIRASAMSSGWWFMKKAWRSRTIVLSFSVAMALSVTVTGFALHYTLYDPRVLSVVASLFVASFCADIRSTYRAYAPAEITALKGTAYVVTQTYLAGMFATACIAGILLAPSLIHASILFSSATIISVAAQLLAGLGAGMVAGCAIAPEGRDISAQFSAVLLCLSVTLLPYAPILPTLPLTVTTLITAGLSLTCVAGSYIFEYKRNPYLWRHHA